MKRSLLTVVAAVFALTACASLESSNALTLVAVQVGTMKFIEKEHDPAARVERAERVQAIAEAAKTFLSGDGVTVGALRVAVLERLAGYDLEPSDEILANALLDVVIEELEARVGVGLIEPGKLVTVNAVLTKVAQAAAVYT